MGKVLEGIWKLMASPQPAKSCKTGKFILSISFEPEDRDALTLSLPPGWTTVHARDTAHALEILRGCESPIVLLDRDLLVFAWRDAVMRLAAAPHRCCVIVLSAVVDQNLWEDAAMRGGYEMLAKPIEAGQLSAVVKAGWSHWHSRGALFTR